MSQLARKVTLGYEDINITEWVLFSKIVLTKSVTTCWSMQANFYGEDNSVADAAQLQRKV